MLEPAEAQIHAFLEAIDAVKSAYRDETFAYVAFRDGTDFRIVRGRLYLNVAPFSLASTSIRSENVRAGIVRVAEMGTDLKGFLSALLAGEVKIPELDLKFPANSGGRYGATYEPLNLEGIRNQCRLRTLTVFGDQIEAHIARIADIDWELRGATVPYDGLQDLLSSLQIGEIQGTIASVEVVALNVAAIHVGSTISGNKAKIYIQIPEYLSRNDVGVRYRILSQGIVVTRGAIEPQKMTWLLDSPFAVGSAELTVPPASVVQCVAVHKNIAQSFYWIADPQNFQNPRRATFESADPGLEILRGALDRAQEKNPDSRAFEAAIACLLWITGFSPIHLGAGKSYSDSVDIMMASPNGSIAVIECTTGLLKVENKLAKLHERTQQIRRKLDESNNRHLRLLPIIVTARRLEEVEPDIDQARQWGIYVIAREAIDQLFLRTQLQPSADEFFVEADRVASEAQSHRNNSLP